MCGRYVVAAAESPERAEIEFNERTISFPPRYNCAPTDALPVYRLDRQRSGGELALLRWGLIPSWAKDKRIGVKLINARADSILSKPAFRNAFLRRRCLVPMSGFYEWTATPGGKVPHYVYLLNTPLFAAAGLWEWWRGPEGAEPVQSFTIITTGANQLVSTLHDRMPVIMAPDDYEQWLDPRCEDPASLQALLRPFPEEEMGRHRVSPRVNSVKNDGSELIEPIAESSPA